jgi:membrane protein
MSWSAQIHAIRERIGKVMETIRIPFLEGMNLRSILRFFYEAIWEGSISARASSIAYSFFLAIFPGILFFFTLIPYFPIPNLQTEVFRLLRDVLPPQSYDAAYTTIADVLNNKNSGLLSFGFFAALLFATNGTSSLLSNFGQTIHRKESVEFWKLYLYSLLLTIIFSAVFFTGIISIVMTQSVTDFMVSKDWIQQANADFLQKTRWLFLLGTLLFSVSALYFFSPLRKKQWGFFSIGAIFATALIIASSSGFSYYVDNFSQYNRLYGSIGTLMVIMLWIYINAFVLIIGFELNMSVAVAERASMDAKNQALSEKG